MLLLNQLARHPIGLAGTMRKWMPLSAIRSAFRRLRPSRWSFSWMHPAPCRSERDPENPPESSHIHFFRLAVYERTHSFQPLSDWIVANRSAGIASIAHDFYPGGRHEMLHELNRREVFTNLLVWISGILKRES